MPMAVFRTPSVSAACLVVATALGMAQTLPEDAAGTCLRGELIGYPGPWSFLIGKSAIILVSDRELEDLADPDKPVNLSLGPQPHMSTLREVCTRARAAGHQTLIVAFDEFFSQYRPGQGDRPRRYTPDRPETVERLAAVSRFAEGFGLGLELSLLSPLEIGPGYREQTGESGLWMHYRKGVRDPQSGQYSVQLWRQTRWVNNKGTILPEDAGVRVLAFREKPIPGTPYRHVDPDEIVEVSETAAVEVWDGARTRPADAVRIRVHGRGGPPAAAGLDRVLVVQMYRTPEMDYFSESAGPYLKQLCDRYVEAGVRLNALYSDEMHIQQDWAYHAHHDHGEFALRYVSPGLARRFAEAFGAQYADFARLLIYFACGQEDAAADLSAKERVMHVMGPAPEDIRATALLRARYYRLLTDGVVDLFVQARRHLEQRLGRRLEARGHATWAESPTCDIWRAGSPYEYTSDFVWSNTVHQAAAACHDPFKWGDFLTGNGNDIAEGGFLDRNYVGLTLAHSTGILNEVPCAYAAHWGMPQAVARRRQALVNASGASAWAPFAMVQDAAHRDTDVLMLYPMDLVAVDERFGNWMCQYPGANLVPARLLVARGAVRDGAVELAGRRFTTLTALFEPLPPPALLDMMERMARGGGRVIWSGPPPLIFDDGTPALARWQNLFAVDHPPRQDDGLMVPGRQVVFEDILAGLPPMTVLTDLLVDRIYPVAPRQGARPLAWVTRHLVGTLRRLDGGGVAVFLGFRPRDDQSASLGHESRWWFEILDRLGAYPPTGRFPGVNDHPDHLSRTTDLLVCRFPNGAVGIAPHLRRLQECWPGGFARNHEEDQALVERLDLPSEEFALEAFKVQGHEVTCRGRGAMTFRCDGHGRPVAFAGQGSDRITVDGREWVFADQPLATAAWAPVHPSRRVPGGATMLMFFEGTAGVRIPAVEVPDPFELVVEGPLPGSRGRTIPAARQADSLVFQLQPRDAGRWLYVVPSKPADGS